MQAASPAASTRRLRQRARLLVQGIDAAPAAAQTETGFDAGRVAPRVQADRQSSVIVDVRFATNLCMTRVLWIAYEFILTVARKRQWPGAPSV